MVAWGESVGHSHTGVTQQRDPDLEGAPVLGSPHGRADFLGDPGFLLLILICLLLGRKVMTNLDSILKSRDITLPTKIHIAKAMVFPIVVYGSESWTIKKAECQIIYAFKLWCWIRLSRVPWTARSNQLILKEINPEHSLEGLMPKLKL